MPNCPCQSGECYEACCGPYLNGQALPDTPLALMRSRYTAFTQGNVAYLCQTVAGRALKKFDSKAAKAWIDRITWQGLEILDFSQNGDQGEVEFIARYIENQSFCAIHERSRFKKQNGRWYYVNTLQARASSKGR